MANGEVSMSMGDVVVVKAAGDVDGTKTQVILQLQPITAGLCEESSEVNAAVLAVETEQGEAPADGEEVEFGYPITCGESKAVLLFKKFVCPGINVRCVKYDDQLISPKQFVHLAGKATLKDWKRAIRLGGVMLRKMMDSGQLDFYQHDTVCTNTCRSTKFDLLISNARCPPLACQDSLSSTTPPENSGLATVVEDTTREGPPPAEWSSSPPETEVKREADSISEETLSFWKGIADVGLMGEVVANICTELLEMLRGVLQRSGMTDPQETDCPVADMAVLNNLAQVFGLLDLVKRTLESRRQQTDPSQEHVHSMLAGLEQQFEEQKRHARDWLARSQAINCTPLSPVGSSKPPAKRPRLRRPVSTALLTTSASQLPQQFTVLSPITLSSLGQPFSMAGLPLAQTAGTVTLHSLPAGSQLFTRYTSSSPGKPDSLAFHPSPSLTLLSASAVQDPGQLGAMVTPVELVHLAQEEDEEEEKGGSRGGTGEEAEEEGQTHTTVIEIDPAPGDHTGAALALQLREEGVGEDENGVVEMEGEEGGMVVQGEMEMEMLGEGEEGGLVVQGQMEMVGEIEGGGGVVVHGEMVEVEEVGGGASLVVHGGMEGLEGLEMEQQGQLHNVQIVVIEDESHEEIEAK